MNTDLLDRLAAARAYSQSRIQNASRNRNHADDDAAIQNARTILAGVYGPERSFTDYNGTALDKYNCIDIEWNRYRVAVRNQPNNFAIWRKDIRLRYETSNGYAGEWSKLQTVNPVPDIYVFTYTDGSAGTLLGWHIINIQKLIKLITDPFVLYKEIGRNNSGIMDQTTAFRVLDVSIYPQIVARSSMSDVTAIAPLPQILQDATDVYAPIVP